MRYPSALWRSGWNTLPQAASARGRIQLDLAIEDHTSGRVPVSTRAPKRDRVVGSDVAGSRPRSTICRNAHPRRKGRDETDRETSAVLAPVLPLSKRPGKLRVT